MDTNQARATTQDDDCWHGKTIVIDESDDAGGHLWMPKGEMFRITRNRHFLRVPFGGITCYQIEFYTGDLRDVWRSIWLLDPGSTQASVVPRTKGVQFKCLQGYMPVVEMLQQDGAPVYRPRVDSIRMEYHPNENCPNHPISDRVHVIFNWDQENVAEAGTASGPPR